MAKKHIMVVEDESITAMRILSSLEKMGYAVTSPVLSADEAIEKAREDRPDLVLMDINLKGEKDGIEAAGQIRSQHNIPVVYLTAYSDEKMMKRIKSSEPFGYIIKPFDDDELHIAIEIAIYKHKMEEVLSKRERQLADSQKVAHLGSWEWDIVNNKITWSDELYRIFGVNKRSFKATYKSFIYMVHPEDRITLDNAVKESFREKKPYFIDARIIRRDGSEWIMEARGEVICDKSGTPVFMEGTAQDITERKNLEEELWRHREHLMKLVDERTSELKETNMKLVLEIEERKKLEKIILETEDRERRRIGYDLHNSLGQVLTGISFISRYLENRLKESSLPEAEDAKRIASLVDQSKEQVRVLAKGIAPVDSDREGFMTALEELAFNTENIFGISCVFNYNGSIRIQNDIAVLHLYRIAQEAVTNAVRHGKSSNIKISLKKELDKITIAIYDDGTGITADSFQKDGMGLRIMNYRADIINASLYIQPNNDKGTTVTCIYIDSTDSKY